MQREEEKILKHRFVNLTPAVSQRAFGKNYCVDQIWFSQKGMVMCCKYNFAALENNVETNKFVEGGKFLDTTRALYKVAYLAKQASEEVSYTVHYEDRFLGLIDVSVEDFLESEIPFHRVKLFKKDGQIIWDRKNKYTLI